MKQPSRGRILLVSSVLMVVPLIPSWLAGPLAAAFGADPHAAKTGAGIFTVMLFIGVLCIASELIHRFDDDDAEERGDRIDE